MHFKKFLFISLVFGMSSLVAGELKVHQDEIEILVNDLLDEGTSVATPAVSSFVQPDYYAQVQEVNAQQEQYFVQMFAFNEFEPKRLLSEIQQLGYEPTISTVIRDGKEVNLVLVGPYVSREMLEEHLLTLRSLSKGAFVYKTD